MQRFCQEVWENKEVVNCAVQFQFGANSKSVLEKEAIIVPEVWLSYWKKYKQGKNRGQKLEILSTKVFNNTEAVRKQKMNLKDIKLADLLLPIFKFIMNILLN